MRKHMTVQGDTWDLLSRKLYRDESFINTLLKANPALRHIALFEEPVPINVPDKPVSRAQSSAALPPWKQV